jgi:hypothetical protein
MAICALAALIGMIVTLRQADVDSIARGILKMPDQGRYDDDPIRWGVIATVFWGMAGFLAGLYIALELTWPQLNLGLEWINFGRLRPLHTSAVIFAFGGNALIATSYYVVQRRRASWPSPASPVSSSGATSCSSCWPPPAICLASPREGIRRAGMVRRPVADDRVGGLPRGLRRHDRQADRAAHLRGQLVLPLVHPDRGDAAHRQQPEPAGLDLRVEELSGVRGRAGRAGAVVVRP